MSWVRGGVGVQFLRILQWFLVLSTLPDNLGGSRGAYHLTEKSGWGVESIMVSDLPVYHRNTTSITLSIQKKGQICVAWVWNCEETEKLVNGKQHSVWFVPTGMKGLPQNVLLNFRLEFPKSDLTIYLPSGISEIFCQNLCYKNYFNRNSMSVFGTNNVTCRAIWCHLSFIPYQFSIFVNVGGWQPWIPSADLNWFPLFYVSGSDFL